MRFTPYSVCRLCPRDCAVDRVAGELGVCGESAECRVGAIEAHFGEEPPLSGSCGSGTVFFSGCSSHCFFCQNEQISQDHQGRLYTPDELLQAVIKLAQSGVHNINFVTPDHFWPHVQFLCESLRERGHRLPLLFNCSGYEKPERVNEYAKHIDIFLPDYKYASPELAEACMGDHDYPDRALQSIIRMVEAKGFLHPWSADGRDTARQGVLVRHLVLPGYVENSLAVLSTLRKTFGRKLPISVMSQFRPVTGCFEKRQLMRPLRPDEYESVCEAVREWGFDQVFIQELSDADDFFPDFENAAPFRGNRVRPV